MGKKVPRSEILDMFLKVYDKYDSGQIMPKGLTTMITRLAVELGRTKELQDRNMDCLPGTQDFDV